MTHKILVGLLVMGLGVAFESGCATKKYVRNTTAPVQAKVDQVGEQTNQNTSQISDTRNEVKQVDERAQSGISPTVDVNLSGIHSKGAVDLDADLVQDTKQCRVSVSDVSRDSTNFDIVLRPNRYTALCGESHPTSVTVTVYANDDRSDVAGKPSVTVYSG